MFEFFVCAEIAHGLNVERSEITLVVAGQSGQVAGAEEAAPIDAATVARFVAAEIPEIDAARQRQGTLRDGDAAARGRLQAEVRTNSRIEALNIGLSLCVFDEGRREINSGR